MYDIFATGRWVNWSSFRFVSSNFIYTCIIFYPCYGMAQVGIVFEVRYEFSYFMDNLIKCKWFMFGTDKSKYSNKTGKGTAILLLHVRVDNFFPYSLFYKMLLTFNKDFITCDIILFSVTWGWYNCLCFVHTVYTYLNI